MTLLLTSLSARKVTHELVIKTRQHKRLLRNM